MGVRIEFEAKVYRWQARTQSWFFVDVPADISSDLRELPAPPRGFGSLRVEARIGGTTWRTSIFPGSETYALPLKRAVRDGEGLSEGQVATVHLDVLEL
ncbi:DUF1905 domain-containing protein [Microbacterium sp.]|uniref:DUF1905 domain-containing protein n=1 Tax=Microbacterium sp. TaxID=51671 RepID=UPI002811FC66|nr:DUF1905 domain-containing protein [Microbacterium sp.]